MARKQILTHADKMRAANQARIAAAKLLPKLLERQSFTRPEHFFNIDGTHRAPKAEPRK